MIKLQIVLNDKNAKQQCNRLKEEYLEEQDKVAVTFLLKELKKFLLDKSEPLKYTNTDCGLTITWFK